MTEAEQETWMARNQRLLVAQLDRLHAVISGQAPAQDAVVPQQTRLAQVVSVFGLSGFERDLLLWCTGAELDERFTPPTFAAALSVLGGGHWDAMATSAPLRRWRLVEPGAGAGLISRPLRIDERILHHLVGVVCLDSRLDGVVRALPDIPGRLTPAQQVIAVDLASRLGSRPEKVVASIHGAGEQTRNRIASHAAAALDLTPLHIPADRIPPLGAENALLALLVEREAALLGALPVITAEPETAPRPVAAFVSELGCSVVLSGLPQLRADLTCAVPSPSIGEQRQLWEQLLGPAGELDGITAAFRLEVEQIEAIALDRPSDLHDACRRSSRGGIADLAQLIEPAAGWEEVVLPEFATEMLRDITAQVRHRTQVYESWGMAGSSGRGLGVTALFTGESGTGKTLAAEVLAGALDLDLYRIDLASVVSKYIGETEKNLKRVFDAADASGAVLLFDEADAIFGKRSEVRDSHDRYANLEVSYLLQRMETYRGLAILTTNLKNSLDRAFLRRLRFVVPFPFPDAQARARIWRLMFPPKTPTANLDWDRLARMQLSGGNIRTIALGAAFLAAAAGEPVGMGHVLTAARREYVKLEKPLTDAELGGGYA
ncbi:ATPase [Rhizocola hellebori]|uniref:ATPase n=1 Tax=Rhizocola hellebori TaxID=1392758 RepID=A0A8J3VIB4_9ACTN|nr:ATP-binding protein [Rhizocola hellebori]GIH06866.1 ATPase [Rhizocola hellebori]